MDFKNFIAFTVLFATTFSFAQSTTGTRPNVVLILADDLGYGDVGFNRDGSFPAEKGIIPTPKLDVLANNGIICTNGHVAHPFCGPSRAALLTGLQPSRIGVQYNLPNDITSTLGIPSGETFFSKILQDNTYNTAAFGKWHLGFEDGKYQPQDRGFDYFFGFLGGGKPYTRDKYDQTWYKWSSTNSSHSTQFNDPAQWSEAKGTITNEYQDPLQRQRNYVDRKEFGETEYLTDVLTDEAINYISDKSGESDPFFVYMAYNAPHTPLEAPAAEIAQFKIDNPNFESLVRNSNYLKEAGGYELNKVETELRKEESFDYDALTQVEKDVKVTEYRSDLLDTYTENRIIYATMVANMDTNIGRIVDELKKDMDVFNNTVIIFLSDNGGYTYSKGAVNHPLFALKGSIFDGGHKVPFFVHWPNKIQTPTTYKYQISSLDLYPTLVDLAGGTVPASKKLDGASFMDKLIAGQPVRAEDPIYVLRPLNGFHAVSIAANPYKAVKRSNNSAWELYNIETDPGETTNITDQSVVLEGLKTKGFSFVEEFKDVKPAWFDHERNGGHPHRSLWFSSFDLPRYEAAFGYTFGSVNPLDLDGDGVLNDSDNCSDTPDGETVDSNGCSQSQLDDDNDSVMNDKDSCPNTTSGETVDANGCTVNSGSDVGVKFEFDTSAENWVADFQVNSLLHEETSGTNGTIALTRTGTNATLKLSGSTIDSGNNYIKIVYKNDSEATNLRYRVKIDDGVNPVTQAYIQKTITPNSTAFVTEYFDLTEIEGWTGSNNSGEVSLMFRGGTDTTAGTIYIDEIEYLYAATATTYSGVVKNPSFDDVPSFISGALDPWSPTNRSFTEISVTTDEFHDGAQSMKIEYIGDANNVNQPIYTSYTHDLGQNYPSGTTFKASLWVKVKSNSGNDTPVMVQANYKQYKDGTALAGVRTSNQTTSASNDAWEKLEYDAAANGELNQLQFRFLIQTKDLVQGDVIYIDEIKTCIDCSSLSVNKIEGSEGKVKLYPNPANEVLFIDAENRNISAVEIYSIVGQKVISVNNFDQKISLLGLLGGIYVAKIKDEYGNISTHRFLKL
jgi:arylsulfatase A-like enzyme